MLEIRPSCENCKTVLTPNSESAMICSFECTFCKSCVEEILHNVCPNCGGGFVPRPIRPKALLDKFPASKKEVYKPIDQSKFKFLRTEKIDVHPRDR